MSHDDSSNPGAPARIPAASLTPTGPDPAREACQALVWSAALALRRLRVLTGNRPLGEIDRNIIEELTGAVTNASAELRLLDRRRDA